MPKETPIRLNIPHIEMFEDEESQKAFEKKYSEIFDNFGKLLKRFKEFAIFGEDRDKFRPEESIKRRDLRIHGKID